MMLQLAIVAKRKRDYNLLLQIYKLIYALGKAYYVLNKPTKEQPFNDVRNV